MRLEGGAISAISAQSEVILLSRFFHLNFAGLTLQRVIMAISDRERHEQADEAMRIASVHAMYGAVGGLAIGLGSLAILKRFGETTRR